MKGGWVSLERKNSLFRTRYFSASSCVSFTDTSSDGVEKDSCHSSACALLWQLHRPTAILGAPSRPRRTQKSERVGKARSQARPSPTRREEHGQVGCQAQDQGGIDEMRATHEPAMLHSDAHPRQTRQTARLTRPRK